MSHPAVAGAFPKGHRWGTRTCPECRTVFKPHIATQTYCNVRCTKRAARRRESARKRRQLAERGPAPAPESGIVEVNCEICGERFKKRRCTSTKFCSRDCVSEHKRRGTPYNGKGLKRICAPSSSPIWPRLVTELWTLICGRELMTAAEICKVAAKELRWSPNTTINVLMFDVHTFRCGDTNRFEVGEPVNE